jgi:PAS domain S-box-containing protein
MLYCLILVLQCLCPSPQAVVSTPEDASDEPLFAGEGEMRARLREFDWTRTPLGPVSLWPKSLRLPVSLCLNLRFPMAIWWGPELTMIYNDAYAPIYGKRHPAALGQSARMSWAETWAAISAQVEAVMKSGESFWNERKLIRTERNGLMEDAWFTWAFSPILGETGRIEGMILTSVEETAHVLRERELVETRDRLATTLAAAEIGSWSVDAATGVVIADANLARAFGVAAETAAAGAPLRVFTDAIHAEDRAATIATINEAMAHRDLFEAEYRIGPREGVIRWVIGRGRVMRDTAGKPLSMSGVLIDITQRKRSEQLVTAQNEVLRLVASETSLARILEELVRRLEQSGEAEDAVSSILLVDADGHLRHGAAPGLPADFNRAVDGILIGENVGTCGRAAFLRETVVTPDLATDPNWAPLQKEVAQLGLLSAWSVPILSVEGKILGTFGTYFRTKRLPTADEKITVDFLSKTAALAIERSRAIDVLRDREEHFRTLADNMSQFAWMADGTGALFWYNQRWFDYTGTTLESMLGWGWQQVHHPDHLERVTEKYKTHVLEGTVWEDTFPLRNAAGEFRWFLSRAVPIRSAAGEVVRWFGTNTDITALREVQEELRLRDERFRQIADTMPQIVWGAKTDGVLDYYNRRWFEYINLPETDLEGARWDQYIHPEDLPATYQSWMQALQSGAAYQAEFRVRGADGSYRWFLTRALPIRDAKGEIVRWFGTCTDIDDRKKSTEEHLLLIERERAARVASEEAGRIKDDFLATLSHELRTPLNPVLLLASEAAANPSLPESVRADFDMIAKNVALEARLIDDLLDLTRITRGKMALAVGPNPLETVLKDAIANVAAEIAEKKIRLVTRFSTPDPVVNGDPVRLQQVFWNILRNATKFTPVGGSIELSTRLTDDGGRIEVRIADSGMGMNPEEVGRLFNAFAQGDHAGKSGSHRFGGLGLGLAISRMLVELHSGRISGSSAGPGQGSVFKVELPLELQPKPAAVSAVNGGVGAGSPRSSPARCSKILLVEDHEPTRASLKHLLLRRHYEVAEAGTFAEGLSLGRKLRFDLLVTDIDLPDGDGYQLMEILGKESPIKGIALTGYGMEKDVEKSRLAGFSTHLTKPIGIQALESALAAITGEP